MMGNDEKTLVTFSINCQGSPGKVLRVAVRSRTKIELLAYSVKETSSFTSLATDQRPALEIAQLIFANRHRLDRVLDGLEVELKQRKGTINRDASSSNWFYLRDCCGVAELHGALVTAVNRLNSQPGPRDPEGRLV